VSGADRRGCTRRRAAAVRTAIAGVIALATTARAATLDGSVRLSWSESDLGATSGSSADHAANLSLTQVLTPYLHLRLLGSYSEQTAATDGGSEFERNTLRPLAELVYARPDLSWRVGWQGQQVESTAAAQEFESNALLASLSWRPRSDLRLGLSYRDATNQTDVSALGRDVDERRGRLDAVYERRHWLLGYTASYSELERHSGGFAVEQLRQDVRLSTSRDLADGRLRLAFSGSAGRLDSEERRGGDDLGEPLPAAQGLFAIDASPAIGELDPAPGLVDGDFAAPTSPPIEIGGANTFRNVGLDLGLPRPASRLEIAVDRISGAQLVWDVFQSADGLVWEPVGVLSRRFDADLLRYTLRFAETSERFLKAVNVSTNPATDVRVTEVRALREIEDLVGSAARESELYRAGASLAWRVSERVAFDAAAETSNDTATTGGVVRRDFRATSVRAGLQVDLARDLALSARFRRGESEERRLGGLTRISDDFALGLHWTPLPTVDALLTASTRTDSDARGELADLEALRATVSLALLDELELVTDVGASRLETAGRGRPRDTLSWTQRVEMRPREAWRVGGGYSWQRTESQDAALPLYESTSVFVDVDWTPGGALTLHGSLTYSDESTSSTLRQSYGLYWSPGPRLNISVGWDQFEQRDGILTASDSLSLNYRAASRLLLFGNVARSRNELGAGADSEILTANFGATVSF